MQMEKVLVQQTLDMIREAVVFVAELDTDWQIQVDKFQFPTKQLMKYDMLHEYDMIWLNIYMSTIPYFRYMMIYDTRLDFRFITQPPTSPQGCCFGSGSFINMLSQPGGQIWEWRLALLEPPIPESTFIFGP